MTPTLLSWLGLLIGALALAGIAWYCRDVPVVDPRPAPVPRKVRGPLADGFCPYCHEPGIYLTRTGQPNRRYHICDPAAVQAQVWPPAPPPSPNQDGGTP